MAWQILHDLEDLCRDWDGREMDGDDWHDGDLRVIAHLTGLSPAEAQELTNNRSRPPSRTERVGSR